MKKFGLILLALWALFNICSCCYESYCNTGSCIKEMKILVTLCQVDCYHDSDCVVPSGRSNSQGPQRPYGTSQKGPFTYGPPENIDFQLSSRKPGDDASHHLMFDVKEGDLSTFEAVITYPKEFTFHDFLTLGPENTPIGSLSVDLDFDEAADITVPIRSEGQFLAYADFDNNGSHDYYLEPDLYYSKDVEDNHIFRIFTRSSNITGSASARVQFTMNEGILTNPASQGTVNVSGTFTSIDPTSGGPDDGIGEPPQTLDFSETVVIVEDATSLDHFLCYKTKGRQDIEVDLSDQFDSGTYAGKKVKLLCTPADKAGDDAGITDPNTHLKTYQIRGPHDKRTHVQVVNQLGTFFFDTKRTSALMVPTSKSLPPEPPPPPPDASIQVDHYRCLSAKITKGTPKFPKGIRVTVTDQFGTRELLIKKPTRLCVPTNKNGEGIKNPDAHLMCYKVKANPKTKKIKDVQTNNQFGEEVLNLKKEREICVPSTKIIE